LRALDHHHQQDRVVKTSHSGSNLGGNITLFKIEW
jgi:hypothetical protein